MKLAGFLSFVAAFGAAIAALAVRGAPSADDRHQRRQQAADVLQDALRAAVDGELSASARHDLLRSACSEAIEILPSESNASGRLAAALRDLETSDTQAADKEPAFRATIKEVADLLAFQPLIEAELPRGFPPPTPIGEVELKQYPAYRMAQTDAVRGNAFWTLFRHIKENKIAMTAPVQMDYGAESGTASFQRSMAFLYGSPELGDLAADGAVRVVDVSPMTVISTGVRGERDPGKLASAKQRLLGWLDANSDRYQALGPIRVMGYNSPFVPANRRYFEVQIPVKVEGAVLGDNESRSRFDLADYVGKHRVLLVFAPSADDAEYARFCSLWEEQTEGVLDRDLLLVEVFQNGASRVGAARLPAGAAPSLRERFDVRPGQTEFVLLGKDGGVKLRRPTLPMPELFAVIDAMPMRRAEMAGKRSG